jgi:hypothetical protein
MVQQRAVPSYQPPGCRLCQLRAGPYASPVSHRNAGPDKTNMGVAINFLQCKLDAALNRREEANKVAKKKHGAIQR